MPGIKFLSTPAIILQSRNFNETTVFITAYSPELGKFDFKASGIKKPNSKLKAVNSLFSTVFLELVKGKSMHRLKGAKLVRDRFALAKNLKCFEGAAKLSKLTQKLTQNENPEEKVFDILTTAFNKLLSSENPEIICAAASVQLLSECGFISKLNTCTICGNKISPEHIHLTPHGFACEQCEQELHATSEIAKVLFFVQQNPLQAISKLCLEKIQVGNLASPVETWQEGLG